MKVLVTGGLGFIGSHTVVELLENGYYVQNIYDYLEYLESSEREKDVLRIPLVKEYIKNRKIK